MIGNNGARGGTRPGWRAEANEVGRAPRRGGPFSLRPRLPLEGWAMQRLSPDLRQRLSMFWSTNPHAGTGVPCDYSNASPFPKLKTTLRASGP